MKARAILLLLAVLALAVAGSGCICCCGLDGLLSKLKGPVTSISVPPTLEAGGQTYRLLYSHDYLNRSAAKTGFKAFIPRIGYDPAQYGASVDNMMDVGSVDQYKWFEYEDSPGRVGLGGFLAKTGSPFVAQAGLQSLSAMMMASLPTINDPLINVGGASNVSRRGSVAIGDGADLYRFTADYNGSVRGCYFLIGRDSNMYVAIYSFSSFNTTEDAARQAIGWIDGAAAAP